MPIGIPTNCLSNLVPIRIKMLSNKKVSTSHASYFLGLSEVKMRFYHYMQGKESLLTYDKVFLSYVRYGISIYVRM